MLSDGIEVGKTGYPGSPKLFDERRTNGRVTLNLEARLLEKRREGTSPKYRYVEVHSSGKWDRDVSEKDKKFLGSIGIIRDITGRKKAEGAVKKHLKELEVFYEKAR